MTAREWDFCDQCIFFICCLRSERRTRGEGCEAFYPYPYSAEAKTERGSWRVLLVERLLTMNSLPSSTWTIKQGQ